MKAHRMPGFAAAALAASAVVLGACTHGGPAGSASTPAAQARSAAPSASSTAPSSKPSSSGKTASPRSGSSTSPKSPAALATVAPVPNRTLPAVPLTSPASYGTGLKAKIVSVRAGKVTDTGRGALTGTPALTFTVSFQNGSRSPVDLHSVQVAASFGANQAPGVPTNLSVTKPVDGTLRPGAATTGTYAFEVPKGSGQRARITVWYAQGKPTVAFSGTIHT